MDLDTNVNNIVQNIISEITTKVQLQVATQIDQKISEIINNLDASSVLAQQLGQRLDAKISQLPIDTKSIEAQLVSKLDSLSSTLSTNIQNQSMTIVNDTIKDQVGRIDFQQLCQSALVSAIQNQTFQYPHGGIPGTAIDTTTLNISGDTVNGGIIKNFGSTGIDDKAENCQLTIMDEVTVVENNLLTKDLTVKGTVTIEGDLNVTGIVPESSQFYLSLVNSTSNSVRASLDRSVFQKYSDTVFQQIKDQGLDLSKISLNGQEIINGGALSNTISVSNLQKVGELKELQVAGETFLSGTLYTTIQRVGINTIEPAQALSIWDQEIEIGFGKKTTNTAIIGTPRPHTLVLSSNGKNNLVLNTDGSVNVNQINMGLVTFTTSATPPSDDRPIASIVFNSNPTLGGPLGWVSLGGAKWANFGVID
jgi:hypothetical protein